MNYITSKTGSLFALGGAYGRFVGHDKGIRRVCKLRLVVVAAAPTKRRKVCPIRLHNDKRYNSIDCHHDIGLQSVRS